MKDEVRKHMDSCSDKSDERSLNDSISCDSLDENPNVYHAGECRKFSVGHSFGFAFAGIAYAFKTQRNIKIHLIVGILAVILGFVLRIDSASWLAVVICIICVFAAELFNTSIESIVDMVCPQWNELAKRAKDCAAGAVFVTALGSLVVGCVVFVPKVIALLF